MYTQLHVHHVPSITLAIAILTIALLIQPTLFSLIAILLQLRLSQYTYGSHMQLYIILKQPIVRREQPYEARQPRIV